jgi:hypothetical protein
LIHNYKIQPPVIQFLSGGILPRSEKSAFGEGRRAETRQAGEQNIGKAGPPERQEMVPDRDRAADSLRPRFGAACHALGQFLLQHDVGKGKPAARLQHPVDLAEQDLLVR